MMIPRKIPTQSQENTKLIDKKKNSEQVIHDKAIFMSKESINNIFYKVIVLLFLCANSLILTGCFSQRGNNINRTEVRETAVQVMGGIKQGCGTEAEYGDDTPEWDGGTITLEQVIACGNDRQKYFDLVMPCYMFYAKKYGVKYPGLHASQPFIELGGDVTYWLSNPNLSYLKAKNNMGGIKESSSSYESFSSIDKYIERKMQLVGQESQYVNVRAQPSAKEYANALTWVYVAGNNEAINNGQSNSSIQEKIGKEPVYESVYDAAVGRDVLIDGYDYVKVIYDDHYVKYGLDKYDTDGKAGATTKSSVIKTNNGTSTGVLVGNTVAEKVWNFLKSEGYSDTAAAGVMGNFQQESSMDPTRLQDGIGPAAGLFQMETYGQYNTRWGEMAKLAESKGREWTDLESQLEFFTTTMDSQFRDYTGLGEIHEYYDSNGIWVDRDVPCTSVNNVPSHDSWAWWPEKMSADEFKQLDDIDLATEIFSRVFERPSVPMMNQRIQYANEYFAQFNGKHQTAQDEKNDACAEAAEENGTYFANAEEIYFFQADPEWTNLPYWGGNFGGSSCGTTSMTMAIDILTGKNLTPKDVYNMRKEAGVNQDSSEYGICGQDSYVAFNDINRKLFGVESVELANTLDAWKDWLVSGKGVIIASRGPGANIWKMANGSFESAAAHSAGHFVCIWKYENGTFYLKQPGLGKELGNNVPYSDAEMQRFIANRSYSQHGVRRAT